MGDDLVERLKRHALSNSEAQEIATALQQQRREIEAETYASWQQKRGMLADTVDWAILEYDEFMKDDAYDSQRVMDRIISRLREVRALLSTPDNPKGGG